VPYSKKEKLKAIKYQNRILRKLAGSPWNMHIHVVRIR